MNLKRLNTPRKFLDRIIHYAVKQRFMLIFPRPSVSYARSYFKNRPINVCEIGILKGENSASILKFLNVKKDFLIDPYEKYSDYKSDGNYNNLVKAEKIAKRKLRGNRHKICFIKEYSDKALDKIPECDFIYIDGNHNYDYVKKDLDIYSKKLNSGGILAGHDTQISDVIKAVAEFASKNRDYKLNVESPDWWMVKS